MDFFSKEAYTPYQLYLFSQLFHNIEKTLSNEPYDILFPIIEVELLDFLLSSFNNSKESEYDCMVNYLNHKYRL